MKNLEQIVKRSYLNDAIDGIGEIVVLTLKEKIQNSPYDSVFFERLNDYFETVNQKTKSEYFNLLDSTGLVVSSSMKEGIIGNNYAFRRYFKRALQGQKDIYTTLGVTTGKRGVYYSFPVMIHDQIEFVLVIKVHLDSLDESLKLMTGVSAIVDDDGIIISSNFPNLILKDSAYFNQFTESKKLRLTQKTRLDFGRGY